jgi:hypothetical protein
MSYAQQKFYEAVVCLVSDRPLRDRLAAAAQYLVVLTPKAFTGSDKKHLKAWKQIMEDPAVPETVPVRCARCEFVC